MATKRNIFGREYATGLGIGQDLRRLVIQEIIEAGGNTNSGEVPRGIYSVVSAKFRLNRQTVTNFWIRYVNEGSMSEKPRHKKGNPKITEPDVRMIEFLKREKPSTTGTEIQDKLKRYSPVSGNVDVSTISRIMTKNLNFTFKRIRRPSGDRFTPENMRYTQAFIN